MNSVGLLLAGTSRTLGSFSVAVDLKLDLRPHEASVNLPCTNNATQDYEVGKPLSS